jgi:hypothetical protein
MTIALPDGLLMTLPAPLACMLFVLEMVLLAQAALWLFNCVGGRKWLERNNEVTGIIFGTVGLVYSLILAFVIIAVWEDYNNLEKTIQTETDRLNSILSHTSTMPPQLKKSFGQSIALYCDQVVNSEWNMDETGTDHPSAIPALRLCLLGTVPQNNMQEKVFDVMDKDLSAVTDLRRERLSHSHSQMPKLIWQILQAGAVILIVFSFFFYVPSTRMKRIYLTFLVSSVSMCMFLIYTLDHPFIGPAGVSNQPYRKVQQEVQAYLRSDGQVELQAPALVNNK